MNVPKAFELALADVLRKHAQLEDGATVRAWQSLRADGSWVEGVDRSFPMLDLRCSPPKTDANQVTLSADCSILLGTKSEDDKDHEIISSMYDSVQAACNRLFSQFRTQTTTGAEYATFTESMAGNVSASEYSFGGFSFGDSMAPYDDNGVNMIGLSMVLHYSRSDF